MLRWSIERLGSVRVVVMVWWDQETVDGDTDGKVAFRWSAQKSRTRKGRRKRDARLVLLAIQGGDHGSIGSVSLHNFSSHHHR